jgi:hypothetical protein
MTRNTKNGSKTEKTKEEQDEEENELQQKFVIIRQLLAGGIGCGISGFVTNPMDVVKIKN